MTIIFYFWLAFNSLASVPESLTDAQLKLLIETKSAPHLRDAVAARAALEAFLRECELERELRRIPVSCFAENRLRKQHRLISADVHERKVRSYSSLCRQVARTSSNLAELNKALKSPTLSVSCRNAVKRRFDDLEYQVGEVRELDRFLK